MSVRGQVYSLAARERGLHEKHSPHRFERQLCSKRIFALALSQHKELEVVHEHGVHALAIDPAEGEYNNTANTGLFLLSLSLPLPLSLSLCLEHLKLPADTTFFSSPVSLSSSFFNN